MSMTLPSDARPVEKRGRRTLAMRGAVVAGLRLHGITPEHGVPTPLPDGFHEWTMSIEERQYAYDHKQATGEDGVALKLDDDRTYLYRLFMQIVALHANDVTVPDGHLPSMDVVGRPHLGAVLAVENGRGLGYVLLQDSTLSRESEDAPPRPAVYDTLTNVYVAHEHRGCGVASGLLAHARERYPLVHALRPFSLLGRAWIEVVAPDMLPEGRNDPCPCGSGAKRKRCHGMGIDG